MHIFGSVLVTKTAPFKTPKMYFINFVHIWWHSLNLCPLWAWPKSRSTRSSLIIRCFTGSNLELLLILPGAQSPLCCKCGRVRESCVFLVPRLHFLSIYTCLTWAGHQTSSHNSLMLTFVTLGPRLSIGNFRSWNDIQWGAILPETIWQSNPDRCVGLLCSTVGKCDLYVQFLAFVPDSENKS